MMHSSLSLFSTEAVQEHLQQTVDTLAEEISLVVFEKLQMERELKEADPKDARKIKRALERNRVILQAKEGQLEATLKRMEAERNKKLSVAKQAEKKQAWDRAVQAAARKQEEERNHAAALELAEQEKWVEVRRSQSKLEKDRACAQQLQEQYLKQQEQEALDHARKLREQEAQDRAFALRTQMDEDLRKQQEEEATRVLIQQMLEETQQLTLAEKLRRQAQEEADAKFAAELRQQEQAEEQARKAQEEARLARERAQLAEERAQEQARLANQGQEWRSVSGRKQESRGSSVLPASARWAERK